MRCKVTKSTLFVKIVHLRNTPLTQSILYYLIIRIAHMQKKIEPKAKHILTGHRYISQANREKAAFRPNILCRSVCLTRADTASDHD